MANTVNPDGGLRRVLTAKRSDIVAAAVRHRAHRVRIFGSVARGDNRADSDVDFLVDFDEGSSLFDLLHLTSELEAIVGRRVDVVSAGGLKPRDERILREAADL